MTWKKETTRKKSDRLAPLEPKPIRASPFVSSGRPDESPKNEQRFPQPSGASKPTFFSRDSFNVRKKVSTL